MKITILCENTVGRLIGLAEHGFSAFIETGKENYLFDTGSGRSILGNSLELKKDLTTIKKIFLSHGHQDHTGGLPEVLKWKGKVDVHGHPGIFQDRLQVSKKDGKEVKRFIGMPYKKSYLESLGAEFVLNRDFFEIEKGVYLTGEVPRKTSFEKPDPELFTETGGQMAPDSISDDQSLIMHTRKGLVLILGCAHSGVLNVINHVINKTGKDRFYAVIGGTHLGFFKEDRIKETVQHLKKLNIEKIGGSHCTGAEGSFWLRQEFGDRFFYGSVGSVLEV